MSLNKARVFLICESSCSAAVLQSGTRWVGVGLGAGVGGEAGAEGRVLCGMVEDSGLVGVIMGRGAEERDMRPCLREWAVGEAKMLPGRMAADDADAEAPMSVSESLEASFMVWSSGRRASGWK